jgi:hypothetical protein
MHPSCVRSAATIATLHHLIRNEDAQADPMTLVQGLATSAKWFRLVPKYGPITMAQVLFLQPLPMQHVANLA